jgi:hypothetical protein
VVSFYLLEESQHRNLGSIKHVSRLNMTQQTRLNISTHLFLAHLSLIIILSTVCACFCIYICSTVFFH